MDFLDLVKATRTCRRFREAEGLPEGALTWLVDCARLSSCATNGQALRFATVESRSVCEAIFPNLAFAGALKDWHGPYEGERPAGYIVILTPRGKREPYNPIDAGIAAQTMQLAAQTRDIGCCILYSVKRDNVSKILGIPEEYEPFLVLAFGMQKEERVIEEVTDPAKLTYWRDEKAVHHVPKLSLDTVLIIRK